MGLMVIYYGLMAETNTQLFVYFSEEFLTPTVVGSYLRTPPTSPPLKHYPTEVRG